MEHHLKIYLFNGKEQQKDVRRIAVDNAITWEQLRTVIQSLFPQRNLDESEIQYRDAEGDSIVMSSAPEWQECLRLAGGVYTVQEPLRLAIKKRKGWKKGCCKRQQQPPVPEVAPAFFYDEAGNTHEPARLNDIKDVALKILSLVAPSWMASPDPSKLPEELLEVIQAHNGGEEGAVDVPIAPLAVFASTLALRKLDAGEHEIALHLLEGSFKLRPTKETSYNIACCHSLMGQPELALVALRKAIDMGYCNWAHMEKDHDLDPLRELEEFKQFFPAPATTPAPTELPSPPTDDKIAPDLKRPAEFAAQLLQNFSSSVAAVARSLQPAVPVKPAEAPIAPEVPVAAPEVPVEEPAQPVDPVVPPKFAEQLAVLHGMGFDDVAAALAVLEETKGNVVLAIDRLLA